MFLDVGDVFGEDGEQKAEGEGGARRRGCCRDDSDCHRYRHQRCFPRQRAFGALAFGDFGSDESGKIAIDLLLVGAVADAAYEQVGTIADEE